MQIGPGSARFYTMEKKFMVRQAHFHIPCAVFLRAIHRYIDHADQSRRNKMWQKMFVGECRSSRVMGERKREEGREREEGRGREEVTLRLHSSSSTQGWQYLQWLYKRWLCTTENHKQLLILINPWRTCTARVTVLGLCVCVCVCLLLNISLFTCHKWY